MEAKELRIGNLVLHPKTNEIVKITRDMFAYHNGLANLEDYKPIPLTEEWLLKFGFERYGNECMYWQLNNVDIWELNGIYANDLDKPILYVHQLQNLYFVLNNEELT